MPPFGMQPDNQALQYLSQSQTMFTGVNPLRQQMFDLSNIPGMSGGMGMMLSMALQPLIYQITRDMGFAGLQFGGTQNLLDRQQAQEFFLESRKAIQEASRRDQEQYFQRLLGVSRLTGTRIGPQQIRAAREMAGDIAGMGMILGDIMPETFDELHGVRGSAAMMARRIHLGGRYAFDPLTGELGMRGETAGRISSQVYENLYGEQADLTRMRGIGAGRMGQLYDELQRRGFLGGGAASREEATRQAFGLNANNPREMALALIRSGAIKSDITAGQIEAGGADGQRAIQSVLQSSQVSDRLVGFESQRISDRLKNMAGAVSAMRDIFGDMGKPNAPMAELINGLQALTQGGLSTMSPAQLEMTVRRTQQLSRMAGISMEGMMQITARGAQLADQYGLDRRFALEATQGAAAFSTAFATVGGGNVPGWRAPDRDRITAIDQSLRLTGARSDIANQFNATLRLFNELQPGDEDRSGNAQRFRGSEFAALAQALQRGQTTYQFGGTRRSVVMTSQAWQRMAEQAGIDPNTAFGIRMDTRANQEYGARFNTGDIARMLQRDVDINPMLNQIGNLAFGNMEAIRRDTNPQRAAQRADRLSTVAIQTLWSMTPEVRNDPTRRLNALVESLSRADPALGASPEGRAQLRESAMRLWTDFEERVQTSEPLQAYGGALGVFAAFDPHTLRVAEQNRARATDRALLHGALSGLGRTGILRRFMDELENTTGKVTVGEVVGKVIGGGVAQADLNQALQNYSKAQAAVDAIRPDDNSPEANARRQQAQANLARSREGVRGLAPDKVTLFHHLNQLGLQHREHEDISRQIAELDNLPDTPENQAKRANLEARRSALTDQMRTTTNQARQMAEQQGYSLGGIGAEDVRSTLEIARNMDTFITGPAPGGAQPGAARTAATAYSQQAQGIYTGLMYDPEKLRRIGRGNLGILRRGTERWGNLNVLAQKHGVTLEQLLTGQLSSIKDPKTRAAVMAQVAAARKEETADLGKLNDLLDPNRQVKPGTIDDDFNREITELREQQALLTQPAYAAEALRKAIYGEHSEAIDIKELTNRLMDPRKRLAAQSMLRSLTAAREKLTAKGGMTVAGRKLTSQEEVNKLFSDPKAQAALKAALGDQEYGNIESLLRVMQHGEKLEDVVGPIDPKLSKAGTEAGGKPVVAKLDGPIDIKGSLTYIDKRTVELNAHGDEPSDTHRTPLGDGDRLSRRTDTGLG